VTSWGLLLRDLLCRRAAAAHARQGPRTHAARACTDGADARQGRGERGSSSRRRGSSGAGVQEQRAQRCSRARMCVQQKHAQGSRRAAEAGLTASRWRRNRWKGRRSCKTRRSGRIWTNASAGASGSVLPVAGSARFRRRVRVQGNRPRASRLGAIGAGSEQEQRAGDATTRGDPKGD
jgi:hypothetical protein